VKILNHFDCYLRSYYDLSVDCALVRNFIIFIRFIPIYQYFFHTLSEIAGTCSRNFFILIVNFVLHDVIHFQIFNNKIILVMNFFLNINRKYDEFSQILQLKMTVKKILTYDS